MSSVPAFSRSSGSFGSADHGFEFFIAQMFFEFDAVQSHGFRQAHAFRRFHSSNGAILLHLTVGKIQKCYQAACSFGEVGPALQEYAAPGQVYTRGIVLDGLLELWGFCKNR